MGLINILWTDEMDAALGDAIRAGATYREAAETLTTEFNRTFTRNMVGGRADRLGLKSLNKPVQPSSKPKGERKPRKPRPKPAPKIVTTASIIAKFSCVEVEPMHLTLIDLERGHCRYVYGDGPFTYCGCPQLDGKPYCGPHFALTSRPDQYRL